MSLPAVYFYLWDRKAERLASAEEGRIEHKGSDFSSSSSDQQ